MLNNKFSFVKAKRLLSARIHICLTVLNCNTKAQSPVNVCLQFIVFSYLELLVIREEADYSI